jgi:hypothetical protein
MTQGKDTGMDGKDDSRNETPRRTDAERQPLRDGHDPRNETDRDAKDGQTRYRDWASI